MSLKVNEIFLGLQGEGRYTGYPVLFIRLSGCSRHCKWCDTKYHTQYKQLSVDTLVKKIKQSKMHQIVWTGGEPLIQLPSIKKVIKRTKNRRHNIESNGDLIKVKKDLYDLAEYFDYICVSPKELSVAKRIHKFITEPWYDFNSDIDIKIVTDLNKVGKDMLKYATTVMPLTAYNKWKDMDIRKKVWNYCTKHNLHFSARIHTMIWGKKKRV